MTELATLETQFDVATLDGWLATRQFAEDRQTCVCGQHTTGLVFGGVRAQWGCFVRSQVAGKELANLRALCAHKAVGVQLDDRAAAAVLECWHAGTDGLLVGSPVASQVGYRAYRWLRARAGSTSRGIAGASRLSGPAAELVADYSARLLRHPDYTDTTQRMRVGEYVFELDRNGHYHSAANIPLGTGDPLHVPHVRDWEHYLDMPGYVELAAPLPDFTHPAFGKVGAGDVLATPTLRYLLKRYALAPLIQSVLVWPYHRPHLDMWSALWRDARKYWTERGDQAARICLSVYKLIVTTFLGGWMRSDEHNNTEMLRPDWCDQIECEAAIRQIYWLDKIDQKPIGTRRDAAWFTSAAPVFTPAGLDLSAKLGGWKLGTDHQTGRVRCVPITRELIAARKTGPDTFVRALLQAVRSDGYQPPPFG